MARKVKNLFKKIGKAYIDGVKELYGPMINYKITPFV